MRGVSIAELARRLNSATVHLGRALRRDAQHSPSRLGNELGSALTVVVFSGPLRIGDLARKERVGAPAMTKTVGLLERGGFVRRMADKDDARAVVIRATKQGERLVLVGRAERVHQIAGGLRQLERSKREQLVAALPALEELVALMEGDDR